MTGKVSKVAGPGHLGLFFIFQFDKGKLITAYISMPLDSTGDGGKKVTIGSRSINARRSADGNYYLLWGEYFLNCPYWGFSVQDRSRYELYPSAKKHNYVFDGLQRRASLEIQRDEDILLDYSPEDRTHKTAMILEGRKKTIMENGNKRRRAH